jgi:hypothetical protein
MYSVASVFSALDSTNDIILTNEDEDVVLQDATGFRCPLSKDRCPHYENPDDCEKGNDQSCKQPMSIFYKQKKLRILFFRFKISCANRNGFIPKDDSALNTVINFFHIDRSLLKSL